MPWSNQVELYIKLMKEGVLQRYAGDGLTNGSVRLLSQAPGQDLQPDGAGPLQGPWN